MLHVSVLSCRIILRNNVFVSVFQLSVQGPESSKLLEYLCASKVDLPVGSCVRSLMLNSFGGIMADAKIARISDDNFYVVVGPAFTKFVQNWIQRNIVDGGFKCTVGDISAEWAVLELQVPLIHANRAT